VKPEKKLWKWLSGLVPGGHYSRIESGATAPGFPDVPYTVSGFSGTIELKANPKTSEIPFPDQKKGLHLSQRVWIKEELLAGGTVWIIAQSGDLIFIIPGSEWQNFNGSTRMELADMSTYVLNKKTDDYGYMTDVMRMTLMRKKK